MTRRFLGRVAICNRRGFRVFPRQWEERMEIVVSLDRVARKMRRLVPHDFAYELADEITDLATRVSTK